MLHLWVVSVLWTVCLRITVASSMDGVNIFGISPCDDIAEVGVSTITVPGRYPASVVLDRPRACRFVIQSQNIMDTILGGVKLQSVLEFPFHLGPSDNITFMDGSLRINYPDPCTLGTTRVPSSLVITANTTQYGTLGHDFSVNGSTMMIDFCTAGSSVPVNFMVSLARSVPAVLVPTPQLAVIIAPPLPENGQSPELAAYAPSAAGGSMGFPFPFMAMQNQQNINTASNLEDADVIPECGRAWTPPMDKTNRIANGVIASSGSFPWTVALVHNRFRQFCGGSILNSQWIVTAAHCVVGPLELRDIIANTTVVAETLDLQGVTPQSKNSYQIDQIAVHPQYEPKGWLNDIALIKLKRKIIFPTAKEGARPICMPKRSLDDLALSQSFYSKNVSCYIAGWGYTKEGAGVSVLSSALASGASFAQATYGNSTTQIGAGSDKLLNARLNFVPLEKCQQNYRIGGMILQGAPQFVRDNMLCASNEQRSQGACLGDSGTGLYCQELDESWGLFGISSWSGGCARKDLPSVFANVYELRSFVERALARTKTASSRTAG